MVSDSSNTMVFWNKPWFWMIIVIMFHSIYVSVLEKKLNLKNTAAMFRICVLLSMHLKIIIIIMSII